MSDARYAGAYNGKQCHEPDFDQCIERANTVGVQKFLFAGGYLEDARTSLELSMKSDHFYSTAGIHPCRALEPFRSEISADCKDASELSGSDRSRLLSDYLAAIEDLIKEAPKNKIVMIGECGLDYDRLEFADKVSQREAFEAHFELAQRYSLPMYLHSRAAKDDFIAMVRANRNMFTTGVVHSFTGCEDEMEHCLDMGLYLGVNGCSLKTQANLRVVKAIPMERLLIETDSPYCDIRNTHASKQFVRTTFDRKQKRKYDPNSGEMILVRDRNEPCNIVQVIEVIAALKGITTEEVAKVTYRNTL